MKTINILGVSEDSIAILFDLLKEIEQISSFILYQNIVNDLKPSLPNSEIKYKIMPFGEAPKTSSNVFFGCATPKIKEKIYTHFNKYHQLKKNNYRQIIHDSSYVADSCILDFGVMIEPHAVISSQTTIGFGVYIKRGSLIGHHNVIGDFSDINPGVVISGKVKIGIGCTIGSGTVIKDNVNIGSHTVIGIGSVVTKDIPENCVAFGNPCKVVRKIK